MNLGSIGARFTSFFNKSTIKSEEKHTAESELNTKFENGKNFLETFEKAKESEPHSYGQVYNTIDHKTELEHKGIINNVTELIMHEPDGDERIIPEPGDSVCRKKQCTKDTVIGQQVVLENNLTFTEDKSAQRVLVSKGLGPITILDDTELTVNSDGVTLNTHISGNSHIASETIHPDKSITIENVSCGDETGKIIQYNISPGGKDVNVADTGIIKPMRVYNHTHYPTNNPINIKECVTYKGEVTNEGTLIYNEKRIDCGKEEWFEHEYKPVLPTDFVLNL